LADYANRPDVIVLALTCGGVPVAYEIAEAIGAPLDVFFVRRLAAPGSEDLAMGAIATGGVSVMNENVVRYLDISNEAVDEVTHRERRELERSERLYRGGLPALDLFGRTIILVDDGLAVIFHTMECDNGHFLTGTTAAVYFANGDHVPVDFHGSGVDELLTAMYGARGATAALGLDLRDGTLEFDDYADNVPDLLGIPASRHHTDGG
jgi:hypothetical protein